LRDNLSLSCRFPRMHRGFPVSAPRMIWYPHTPKAGTPSLGTAGCFSPFHWRCRSSMARLDLGCDRDLPHHASAGATRIDPALYLARCHDLKFTSAIAGFTLPPLPLLKSHENSPRCGRFSASGDTLMDSLRNLVLIMSKALLLLRHSGGP